MIFFDRSLLRKMEIFLHRGPLQIPIRIWVWEKAFDSLPSFSYLNVVTRNEKGCPADNDKEPRWYVVGDDVVRHLPGHDHAEASHGVVARLLGSIVPLVRQKGVDLYLQQQ